VYLIALFIWAFIQLVTITPGAIADTTTTTLFQIFFALNGISVVITLVMAVFYLIDSTQNGSVPKDQRVVWALILLFMGIFTMSVLVRLPRTGPVLLAIDAVVLERLFTPERRAWPTDDDEGQLRASTRKLLDLVARERVALVVFGHDGRQWETLRRAPAFYD